MIVTTICFLAMIQFQSSSSLSSVSLRRMLFMDGDADTHTHTHTDTHTETAMMPYITTTSIDSSSPQQSQQLLASIAAPRIPGRRSPPSHIILCTEFLRRKKMHEEGQAIPNDNDNDNNNNFHVTEDDAVCRDWSTPHSSLMEIASNFIISSAASHYRITYAHNCQRDNAPDPDVDGTTDNHDWTTIQEGFPPSGLILDNGVVDELQIEQQCRQCISSFNEEQHSHEQLQDYDPDDPNPPWFNPHQTHHCILYPKIGSARPIINDQMETDMVAMTEQRAMAQLSPFSKVLDTMKDRLRLAAVEFKLEHGDPPLYNEGSTRSSSRIRSRSTRRSLGSILGFGILGFGNGNGSNNNNNNKRFLKNDGFPIPVGSNIEEQNGAIVFLDEGSFPLSNPTYAKYIPSTVSTIDILTGPMCIEVNLSNGQTCRQHADELQTYLTQMYPSSHVSQHAVLSTAAAYSRMILAKYLVCPPGTNSCLMPAIAKERGTFAAVAESPERSDTFQYFDFVEDSDTDHLQVAHVPHTSESETRAVPDAFKRVFTKDGVSGSDGDGVSDGGSGSAIEPRVIDGSDTDDTRYPSATKADADAETDTSTVTTTTTGGGLSMDSFLSNHEYRDGCVELRGKLGSWELDYSYQDLKHDDASSLLRGQSNVDVTESRFQTDDTPQDQGRFGAGTGAGAGEGDTVEEKFGASWNENVNPECALDLLNLNGLCDIVQMMGLAVIQFVGDQYTEEQVKSFWSLLGLEDREDPEDLGQMPLEDGQDLNVHQYRKTAHCPNDGIAFDIVFTPNEYLIQNVEVPVYIENTPETRYVPVPAPASDAAQHTTNNYFYDNSQTTDTTSTTNTNSESRFADTSNTVRENFSRTSENNNGANGGANWYNQPYGGNGGYGGYSGYGGYGGMGGWGYGGGMNMNMGMMMQPMYSASCCCVPFQQQYQSFGGMGMGMGMQGPGMGGPGPNGGMPGPGPGGTGGGYNPNLGTAGPGGGPNPNITQVKAAGRQVVVAGHTPNTSYDTFVNGIDEFSRGITDYGNKDDVVILRTGIDGNLPDPSRRRMNMNDSNTRNDNDMTPDQLKQANRYVIRAVDEFRRRTKQMDVTGTDPTKSGLPSIHVLDVSQMTSSHPHANQIHHGRRNEQVAPLYDHWNHLLYSNLKDLANAELQRKSLMVRTLVESAPRGSPYHNGVQSFPDPL